MSHFKQIMVCIFRRNALIQKLDMDNAAHYLLLAHLHQVFYSLHFLEPTHLISHKKWIFLGAFSREALLQRHRRERPRRPAHGWVDQVRKTRWVTVSWKKIFKSAFPCRIEKSHPEIMTKLLLNLNEK